MANIQAKTKPLRTTGTGAAPDLLPRVLRIDPGEALIQRLVQRKESAIKMPTWQNEPVVNLRIPDLYAHLSERTQGIQGPVRPVQTVK